VGYGLSVLEDEATVRSMIEGEGVVAFGAGVPVMTGGDWRSPFGGAGGCMRVQQRQERRGRRLSVAGTRRSRRSGKRYRAWLRSSER
jgi:hypothetical protein